MWRDVTRRLLPYLLAMAGGLLIGYLFIFFFVFPSHVIPDERPVPNVMGLDFDGARRRLEASGFTAELGEQRSDTRAPPGVVIAQFPTAGAETDEGTKVRLDLAASQGQRIRR